MSDDVADIASQVVNVFGGKQQLTAMNADAKRMLADAQAGRWAVDEETGSHLRRAITDMEDRLGDVNPRIYLLKQAPKLGNDAYAKQVASHFLTAMHSDDQSLVRVFEATQELLSTLRQAIETAMSKYNATDDAVVDTLSNFKGQELR